MTEPNYFYRFCCIVPTWFTGGMDRSFMSICPCPVAEPVYKSTSQIKNITGIGYNNRYYGLAITSGYTTEFLYPEAAEHFTLTQDGSLLKTRMATTDGIDITYGGSVSVGGSDDKCEATDYPGFFTVTKYEAFNESADYSGGSSIVVGDWQDDSPAYSITGWSYAESCDPPFNEHIFYSRYNSYITVNDDNLTTEYSVCPVYTNDGDPIDGVSGISFIPCGASTLGSSSAGIKTSVKYAYIFKNLRVGESYTAYLRLQYRDYLANYGFEEAPSAEANWSEDTPIQIAEFDADEIIQDSKRSFKVVGGSLNVSDADFLDENYSTSIYAYPDTFYDPTTQEWDTDGEVITPATNLAELSGKQYRIKESYVLRVSPMECEEEDEDEE
tara:strand:+ start:140 stop:1291 length:1152 start_codon:yes stop_codon:yes gene_type:complete